MQWSRRAMKRAVIAAVFDPDAEDACLGTMALTRLLVRQLGVPVIAAGGIMDGAAIAAALRLGAAAAQLGTGFHRLRRIRCGRGLPRSSGQRRCEPYHHDTRDLGPTGSLSAKLLHAIGFGYLAATDSLLSNCLRCRQGAQCCGEGCARGGLRRTLGGTGRAACPGGTRGATRGLAEQKSCDKLITNTSHSE